MPIERTCCRKSESCKCFIQYNFPCTRQNINRHWDPEILEVSKELVPRNVNELPDYRRILDVCEINFISTIMLTQCSRLSYPVCMSKFQTRRFMTFSTDRICRARVVCHNWKKRCDGTPRTVVVTHTLDSYITRPREYHSTVLHRFNPAFHSGHILSKCKRNRYQIDPIQRRSLSSASEMVLNWMNWVQETWTVDFARKFFIFLHDTVGLPWWLAIISGAVVFRVALLPLGILSIQNQAKIEKLLPETHARAHQIVGDTRWYATVHHRSQQWMQQEIRKNVRKM